MAIVLDQIRKQVTTETLSEMSGRLETDQGTLQQAIAATLPLLIGGIARSANVSAGAARRLSHTIDTFAAPEAQTNGHDRVEGFLNDLMGAKLDAVEEGVSEASGLDADQVSRLVRMLLPIILRSLAIVKQERKLNHDGLASLLNRERADVERQAPEVGRGALMDYLEADHPAVVRHDVARIARAMANANLF